MPATYYPAVVDRSASGYGVSFPDFPGLVAAGDTVHDAALSAEIGLSLHLKGLIEDKDDIPSPSSLDDIEAVDGADDIARILVRAETPAKFSRVQVTLEDSLLSAIDAQASNRSGFLSEAAWEKLRLLPRAEKPASPTFLRKLARGDVAKVTLHGAADSDKAGITRNAGRGKTKAAG